jgi:hypothetical protein
VTTPEQVREVRELRLAYERHVTHVANGVSPQPDKCEHCKAFVRNRERKARAYVAPVLACELSYHHYIDY